MNVARFAECSTSCGLKESCTCCGLGTNPNSVARSMMSRVDVFTTTTRGLVSALSSPPRSSARITSDTAAATSYPRLSLSRGSTAMRRRSNALSISDNCVAGRSISFRIRAWRWTGSLFAYDSTFINRRVVKHAKAEPIGLWAVAIRVVLEELWRRGPAWRRHFGRRPTQSDAPLESTQSK